MQYSKWEKNYKKILEKHSAQKLWYVTLEPSDRYGKCVYMLDGKEVSGKITVRKGQKLGLTYTLTDSNYRFSGDISGGVIKTKNANITVSETLDGETVRPDKYIKVVRKGG